MTAAPPAEGAGALPPEAVQTDGAAPGTESEAAAIVEADEPTAEELAALGDAGKRALTTEREKRKAATAENKELRARLEALEQKLNATPVTTAETAAPPMAQTSPAPRAEALALAGCDTFEAVDASARQAATAESVALRLNQVLLREGADAVLAKLPEHGIEVVDGKLVDRTSKQVLGNADADTVASFIANVFEGARQTQAEAPARKQFLATRFQNWQAASAILPAINDQNSPEFKAISGVIQNRPELRNRADGPVIAVKLYLGELAYNAKLPQAAAAAGTRPAAAAATPPKPAPSPTLRSAPGAPRTSAAALPRTSERDALAAKISNGTATMKDVDRYASLSVQPASGG